MRTLFRLMVVFLVVSASLCWQAAVSRGRQAGPKDPATLDEFQLVFRGRMSRDRALRPLRVARMDNNGEILMSCLKPATEAQLKTRGIPFLPSQLELLVDWNLLKYDAPNRTYTTTIHVYGSHESSALRRMVGAAVKKLAGELRSELDALRNHLLETNHEMSLFPLLYAYVLHAFSMERFGQEIYQEPQLSAEKPFWNGFAWAVYPVREFPVANTFFPMEGNGRLFVVSAEALAGPGFRDLMRLVKDISGDLRIDDHRIIRMFQGFGVCDAGGELLIPVIEPAWARRLERMASDVYDQTVALAAHEPMDALLGMDMQAQAAMFLHYEIRYAFVRELLDTGVVPEPVDFQNPEKNRALDVKNLMFILKNPESR